ncbi:unnamed protein product [Parnassius apollo]|uniref:(apollo) hypothetical protein n=1 Tax=Parnassius apollo TaxID=110799 RepID=A0A8S3WSI0_PARAO|nr:unnamed protein product [Parnassius apollo]
MKYDKQCKFCEEIYDKLISSRITLKSKTKSDGTKWISEIQRLLSNKRKIEIGHEKISYLESPLHICATTNSKQDILGNVSEERIIKDKQSFKYVFPEINTEHRDLIKYTSSTELVKNVREQTKIKTDIARNKLELNETTKISKRKRTSPSRIAIEVENKYIQKIESDSKAGKTINIHKRRLQGGRDINELASTKPKLVESYSGDRDVMAKYTNLTTNEGKKNDVGKGEKNHSKGVKDSGGDIAKKDKLKSKSLKKSQLVSNTKEPEHKTNGKSLASEFIKRRKNTKENSKPYPNDFDKKGKLKSQISKESQLKGNTKQAQRKTRSKSLALEGLNLHRVKVRKASIDDLQLNTVKVKHSTFPPEKQIKLTQLSDINISPTIIRKHQTHKSSKSLSDSDSELDNIDVQRDRVNEVSEIIIGQKILKRRAPFINKTNKKAFDPMLFESSLKKNEINLLPKEKNGKNSSVTEHISVSKFI